MGRHDHPGRILSQAGSDIREPRIITTCYKRTHVLPVWLLQQAPAVLSKAVAAGVASSPLPSCPLHCLSKASGLKIVLFAGASRFVRVDSLKQHAHTCCWRNSRRTSLLLGWREKQEPSPGKHLLSCCLAPKHIDLPQHNPSGPVVIPCSLSGGNQVSVETRDCAPLEVQTAAVDKGMCWLEPPDWPFCGCIPCGQPGGRALLVSLLGQTQASHHQSFLSHCSLLQFMLVFCVFVLKNVF